MDDLEPFDGPFGPDLELVARLRDDPAPDEASAARHRGQLMAVIQAATTPAIRSATPSAGTTSNNGTTPPSSPAGDEMPIVDLRLRHPGGESRSGGRRRNHRRLAAAVAAAAVLAGGLLAVRHVVPDRTESTVAGPSETGPCGTELPFAFPVPAGFEGPVAGPSKPRRHHSGQEDAPLQLHWRNGETTIDVRWPASVRRDPTTPIPEGRTDVLRHPADPPVEGSSQESFYSRVLGAGACDGIEVEVTSADPHADGDLDADGDPDAAVVDQIEMALLGPGGPLEQDVPLVVDSTPADELPPITESPHCPPPGTLGGQVDAAATYPTARDALGFYVAAHDFLPLDGYRELTLPDGSYGYAFEDPTLSDGGTYVTVLVVPDNNGYRVAAWASSTC
jgi:hypothetical protein